MTSLLRDLLKGGSARHVGRQSQEELGIKPPYELHVLGKLSGEDTGRQLMSMIEESGLFPEGRPSKIVNDVLIDPAGNAVNLTDANDIADYVEMLQGTMKPSEPSEPGQEPGPYPQEAIAQMAGPQPEGREMPMRRRSPRGRLEMVMRGTPAGADIDQMVGITTRPIKGKIYERLLSKAFAAPDSKGFIPVSVLPKEIQEAFGGRATGWNPKELSTRERFVLKKLIKTLTGRSQR